jgi:hypothetical protein
VSLTGHELADFLVKRYPAASLSKDANRVLDIYTEMFADLMHYIADTTAITPEQTLALRALHDAHRAAIFALVSHQPKEGYLSE